MPLGEQTRSPPLRSSSTSTRSAQSQQPPLFVVVVVVAATAASRQTRAQLRARNVTLTLSQLREQAIANSYSRILQRSGKAIGTFIRSQLRK